MNVSEALNQVPGTVVQNRDSYAQEQQIIVRGFGARAGFGTRGVKLLADGIPASTPDGQGGPGLFDLDSAGRIEVLRGPFSALYGNHSGGVVQVFTQDGPEQPTLSVMGLGGSWGTWKAGAKFGGTSDALNYVGSLSTFPTDCATPKCASNRATTSSVPTRSTRQAPRWAPAAARRTQ